MNLKKIIKLFVQLALTAMGYPSPTIFITLAEII